MTIPVTRYTITFNKKRRKTMTYKELYKAIPEVDGNTLSDIIYYLDCQDVVSTTTVDSYRWWDIIEVTVKLSNDTLVRYLTAHTTGDNSPNDLGFEQEDFGVTHMRVVQPKVTLDDYTPLAHKGKRTVMVELKEQLKTNDGKIPYTYVEYILNHPKTKVAHVQVTPNTRVCVITTVHGHDLVGYAQVLDASNDVQSIGEEVAYNNAKENLWQVLGSIAKVLV